MDGFFGSNGISDRRHTTYAVVVYLPRHLDSIVAPLREKYDPDFNIVDSHISLVYPFDIGLPLDRLTGIIKKHLERVEPIMIELDSIGDFYPVSPCIYWEVKKNLKLNELHYSLYSCLNLPLLQKVYVPHVTVAKEISNHRLVLVKDRIAAYLTREKFKAARVDLITPLAGQKWVSVGAFALRNISFLT